MTDKAWYQLRNSASKFVGMELGGITPIDWDTGCAIF